MKFEQFKSELEKDYLELFPDSQIIITNETNIYRCITITCLLSKSADECAHNIRQNDMLNMRFSVTQARGEQLPKNYDTLEGLELQIESWNNSYKIKPDNKYHVFSSKKVKFRKSKGNAQKIIKDVQKLFTRLQESLIVDYESDNIHESYKELVFNKVVSKSW